MNANQNSILYTKYVHPLVEIPVSKSEERYLKRNVGDLNNVYYVYLSSLIFPQHRERNWYFPNDWRYFMKEYGVPSVYYLNEEKSTISILCPLGDSGHKHPLRIRRLYDRDISTILFGHLKEATGQDLIEAL